MADYRGYPMVECPKCGDSATVIEAVHPGRPFGPGEWAIYGCGHCRSEFQAIVPEPPDGYEGDGVFAENH